MEDVDLLVDEEEKKERVDALLVDVPRVHCQACSPIKEGYPHMFLILFGNDIQLLDPSTLHRATLIVRSSHPHGALHMINEHPSYIRYPGFPKSVPMNKLWKMYLIIGPFTPSMSEFQSTSDIVRVEKEWEQKTRKVLTRLIWGVWFWMRHKDTTNLGCYVDPCARTLVCKIIEHHQYTPESFVNIKAIYDQVL